MFYCKNKVTCISDVLRNEQMDWTFSFLAELSLSTQTLVWRMVTVRKTKTRENEREEKRWGKATLVLPQEASSHSPVVPRVDLWEWPPTKPKQSPPGVSQREKALCMNIGVPRGWGGGVISLHWLRTWEKKKDKLKRTVCNYAPGTTAEKIKKTPLPPEKQKKARVCYFPILSNCRWVLR